MTEPLGNVPSSSFLDSLGTRGHRRAEPRASIAVAGAGCALAVIGALVVSGDTGIGNGNFNNVPGAVMSALIVAAGLLTLTAVRQGPIATAGAAAAGLGVPPLMFFITWSDSGVPPFSIDAILVVSTLAWLAMYAAGPGRGRPFFLGAGLIGLWFTILQVTEKVFELPFVGLAAFGGGSFESFEEVGEPFDPNGDFGSGDFGSGDFGSGDFGSGDFGSPPMDDFGFSGGFDAPDPTTLGVLSLGLGVAYLVICRWLDRQGRHGAATPFALATLPTLFVGSILLGDDLEAAGTGLLLMLIGAALAFHGGTMGRRATAWVGGGTAAFGLTVFLSDMTEDATVLGMLFMAGGIALVAIAHAVAAALNEPDEMAVTEPVTVPQSAAAPPPPDAGGSDDSDWAPPPPS